MSEAKSRSARILKLMDRFSLAALEISMSFADGAVSKFKKVFNSSLYLAFAGVATTITVVACAPLPTPVLEFAGAAAFACFGAFAGGAGSVLACAYARRAILLGYAFGDAVVGETSQPLRDRKSARAIGHFFPGAMALVSAAVVGFSGYEFTSEKMHAAGKPVAIITTAHLG